MGDQFDEIAQAVTALESARLKFSRMHHLITDAGWDDRNGDSLRAIDDADAAYQDWRDTAYRLRELRSK